MADFSVSIVSGAGNAARSIPCHDGDTVSVVLERAGISLQEGKTVTLGRKRISDPATTTVQPDDLLVIASKVSNG